MTEASEQTAVTVVRTSMFSDGVRSVFSLFWRAKRVKWVKSAAVQQKSSETLLGPTRSFLFTMSSCLRTSSSFLRCFILPADTSATHQQHTANRHNTSGFIFSESARSKGAFQKIGWNCGVSHILPFYTYSWGDRKTTRRELEICRNRRVWLMTFFSTGHYVIRRCRQAARAWGRGDAGVWT